MENTMAGRAQTIYFVINRETASSNLYGISLKKLCGLISQKVELSHNTNCNINLDCGKYIHVMLC